MDELMHKKLEAELVSLAHSILQMKNKDDVNALHKKAHDIYEKLSVLKFVDSYLQTTPNTTETKEEIIDLIKDHEQEIVNEDTIEPDVVEEEIIEENHETEDEIEEVSVAVEDEIEEKTELEESIDDEEISLELEVDSQIKDEDDINILVEENKVSTLFQTSLEDEFQDAISADIATNLFEKATKDQPVIESEKVDKKVSLNDSLFKSNLQIGLNDRIAFVKHLFDGSQGDFNRVVSQLNSFKTEKEAKSFVKKLVKPDYNWDGKEMYEERLMDMIERKFV